MTIQADKVREVSSPSPRRLALLSRHEQHWLVAFRDARHFKGIVLRRQPSAVLVQLLSQPHRRHMKTWRYYEARKGGDAFLKELDELTEIVAKRGNEDLTTLLAVTGPHEFFHNYAQAEFIDAIRSMGGRADVLQPRPHQRTADIHVRSPRSFEIEIETLPGLQSLQRVSQGFRLSPRQAGLLFIRLRRRIVDGLDQVSSGTVLLKVWCDHVAELIEASVVWREALIPTSALLERDLIVVATRLGDGDRRLYGFQKERWEPDLRRACESLTVPQRVRLALSVGEFVGCGEGPLNVGRLLKIENAQLQYAEDERQPILASRVLRSLIDEQLSTAGSVAKAATEHLETALANMGHAVPRGRVPLSELFVHPYFRPLWDGAIGICSLAGCLVGTAQGAIAEDLEAFTPVFVRIMQAGRTQWQPDALAEASRALLSLEYHVDILTRLAKLLMEVVTIEQALRHQDVRRTDPSTSD